MGRGDVKARDGGGGRVAIGPWDLIAGSFFRGRGRRAPMPLSMIDQC